MTAMSRASDVTPGPAADAALAGASSRRAVLAAALGLLSLPARHAGATQARSQTATADATRRLDRLDLRHYIDAAGRTRPVVTPDDWQHRRAAIHRAMQHVMGPLPAGIASRGETAHASSRRPPAWEVIAEADAGTYVRRSIAYTVDDGPKTPAYLCIPKSVLGDAATGAAAPAVLCLHPTDDTIGHGVVVGLGGRPNRAYAAELAERGFVTLAPAYPLLADYQPDVLALGYASGTMKAIHDNVRGLDLLDSLPFVRAGRHGAIGHSLGGHNAIYTAVFEPRLTAIASSCGFDLFVDYYGGRPDVWQREKGWCQVRYMPRLLEYAGRLADIPFDFAELLGALAPRACFVSAPTGDTNFQWRSVARAVDAASAVYTLHDAPERLVVRHPEADHDFPEPMRLEAYAMFERVLR